MFQFSKISDATSYYKIRTKYNHYTLLRYVLKAHAVEINRQSQVYLSHYLLPNFIKVSLLLEIKRIIFSLMYKINTYHSDVKSKIFRKLAILNTGYNIIIYTGLSSYSGLGLGCTTHFIGCR